MYKDRRDTLSLEDIENAAKENGHPELVLLSHRGNQMVVREDHTYLAPEELFR